MTVLCENIPNQNQKIRVFINPLLTNDALANIISLEQFFKPPAFCRRNAANITQEEIIMVFEKIKAILAEQFDVEEESITPETNIQEDLGADSLDVVDLIMSIEEEFEFEVPDSEVENIKTVGALVQFVEDNI